jgi:hypothetical protein
VQLGEARTAVALVAGVLDRFRQLGNRRLAAIAAALAAAAASLCGDHADAQRRSLEAFEFTEGRDTGREAGESTYARAVEPPICPDCGQPASQALAGPEHGYECRNEACPEFGQPVAAGEPTS